MQEHRRERLQKERLPQGMPRALVLDDDGDEDRVTLVGREARTIAERGENVGDRRVRGERRVTRTGRGVDGVAILTFGMEESLLEHLRFRKVPLVFVDVGPDAPRIANIRIDYLAGIRQEVQHLAALGHKRIAFIAGPEHLKSAGARKTAFRQAMGEIRLSADQIVKGDHTMEGGMRSLTELITSQGQRPTAILCSNDMTAIGVLREAYDRDIKIPGGLSVVGFDDIRLAQFTTPPLTTVQMSQTELARLAFRALMSAIEQPGPTPHRNEYTIVTSLVLRRSTALALPEPERA